MTKIKQAKPEILPPKRRIARLAAPARVSRPAKGPTKARKADQAIAALLEGRTIVEAAKVAKIGERTLQEWLASPWFRAEYDAAKRRLLNETIASLRAIGRGTVHKLNDILSDKTATPIARVSAGRAILDTLLRSVEMEDIVAQLEELKEALRQRELEDDLL